MKSVEATPKLEAVLRRQLHWRAIEAGRVALGRPRARASSRLKERRNDRAMHYGATAGRPAGKGRDRSRNVARRRRLKGWK